MKRVPSSVKVAGMCPPTPQVKRPRADLHGKEVGSQSERTCTLTELIIPGFLSDANQNRVTWRDLQPRTDAAQAREFLQVLHGDAPGYATLTLIGKGQTARNKVITGSDTWSDVVTELGDNDRWWSFCEMDDPRWNAYTMVCTLKRPPRKGSRGEGRDAVQLPGLFADLDVNGDKPGSFATRRELDDFLSKLPRPTMLVNTGSGGCHPYWLFTERVTDMTVADQLLAGWYDYLAGFTTRKLDHVQERARILRVAGTVRWARYGEQASRCWSPVELVWSDGPRYDWHDLHEIVEPLRRAAEKYHHENREIWLDAQDSRVRWLERCGLPAARRLALEAALVEKTDWAELLEAAGWSLFKDNRRTGGTTDCRYWTRPGKSIADGKSAMTDFREKPHVMFIYSNEPDLDPCVIPTEDRFTRITSKYQFALHFLFDGDEARLLKSIAEGRGRLA